MKGDKMLDLFSEIDGKFVTEAENSGAKKSKRIRRIALSAAATAACVCIAIAASMLPKYSNSTEETGGTSKSGEIKYSSVAEKGESTGIDVSDYTNITWGTADIAAFSEDMLAGDCVAIVEGVITQVKEKFYNYSLKSNKFGENTVLEYNSQSIVYKMSVKKSFFGNIKNGEAITVEDVNFVYCSKTWALKKGKTYVVALYKANDDIISEEEKEKLISGEVKREGEYGTAYPYHPQIESAKGGYILSNDWETLTKPTDSKITFDSQVNEFEFYEDKMVYVKSEDFALRMKALVEKISES